MHSSVCNNSLKLLAIDNYIEGLDVYQLSQIVRKSTHTISRNVKRYEEESTHERQGNSTCGREPQIDVSLGSHIQYFYDKIPSLYHDETWEWSEDLEKSMIMLEAYPATTHEHPKSIPP
ncbi:hypothetical protein G7K_0340-t1 [Saitoella complicata NRRL Y-17804]|uniref:Uncharacterized protein n=1 Tax=Saitoella complicata (strain BCRC 22490 / CBS 7301 / JCM 7358 / NBRC 10748 / NRRL Y-17804) TaxID=698492 RepID=A0A0E9N9L2_SAICN|nr:hypothetical protein G7K_0340-t1 [Saitoella complicata NRRL Y-17804]